MGSDSGKREPVLTACALAYSVRCACTWSYSTYLEEDADGGFPQRAQGGGLNRARSSKNGGLKKLGAYYFMSKLVKLKRTVKPGAC